MTWLTEDPTLTLVMGAMAVLVLAVALFKTGRVIFFAAIVLVAAMVGGLVLVERLIVTDREQVDATIRKIAEAFERGDATAVSDGIAPEAKPLRDRAAWVLRSVNIDEVKITSGPIIAINELTSPKSADVELVAVVRGTAKNVSSGHDQYAAKLFLKLRQQDGKWLVESYEQDLPFGQSR